MTDGMRSTLMADMRGKRRGLLQGPEPIGEPLLRLVQAQGGRAARREAGQAASAAGRVPGRPQPEAAETPQLGAAAAPEAVRTCGELAYRAVAAIDSGKKDR